MCRVTGPSTSRGNNRRAVVVRTVNFDDGCHPARDTPKNRALQDDLLMQTVSTGSEASDGDGATSSSSSSSSSSLRTHARSAGAGGLSVTGRTSNVHDDYVIFPKVLGEGHYGKVRECVHRTSRLVRACKTIDKSRIGRLDHLQREVHLLSCIEHGGIMRMVDCYEDEEYVHIVTERYTGGELFEKIIDSTTPRGCLSEERTSHVIGSLLDAVGYLHENDIVHRDIKPENILFESKREDSIRLIDFGLSRRHGRGDAHMSNPVGTAYYMSPELLKGKYDKSCDLWSVGVVAYILLCGYPPFNGDTDLDIFDSIKRGHFEFPNQAWSDKSDMARDFIKCLLRRDPRKRFTAKEASLHPWIANQRTTTRQQCPR